jgi:hypothetical protein
VSTLDNLKKARLLVARRAGFDDWEALVTSMPA